MSQVTEDKAKVEAEVSALKEKAVADVKKAGLWVHLHVGAVIAIAAVVGFIVGVLI